MHIVIIGTGYVGLVTGSCFAEMGHTVTCLDIDKEKITKLKQGVLPIYEPGLDELVARNAKDGRLQFTDDYASCIPQADACFFALPTPSNEDGSCDVSYVLAAAETVAKHLQGYTVIVMKSTVPVGTGKKVRKTIETISPAIEFDMVANPEFLKEGSAIQDCMKPSRIVVGVESDRARQVMERIYSAFTLNHNRILFMDVPSAEITKYAANAMLATRISFMNELSELCELVGADITKIRTGIGSDERIGYDFLYAGPGFGGSCFPKDIRALAKTADSFEIDLGIIKAVDEANNRQKKVLFSKVKRHFEKRGGFENITVCVWGLSFKPNTDDVRESPALTLIEQLLNAGIKVKAFDPIAMDTAKKALPPHKNLHFASTQYDAADDADALILATEWKQFRFPDLNELKKRMSGSVIFDGRNQYDSNELIKYGFTYYGIGKARPPSQLLEELSLLGPTIQR